MKIFKRILPLFFILILTSAARAYVLFNDATNYPYANGLIETQGQWYVYYPKTPILDAYVTNNVLLLNSTNKDNVGTPTNGWSNPTEFNYASFRINISQLPSSTNGGYFCQLQDINDTNDCCHVFIDTRDTSVPGTYRLAIGNYTTSFSALAGPPNNYPMDLATDVWYNVVILFDTNSSDFTFVGATLWINPSYNDYLNVADGDDLGGGQGVNYVYGTDKTSSTGLLDIAISQIGFSPYINGGISNVISGTTFNDVNSTNLPVYGIQPQSATNYSGNPTSFYAVASGVDLTYQWYSTTFGQLSDGANYSGSQSDALTVNNQTASDTYYCIVTDAYGNSLTSSNAVDTVITTPTAIFFPTNEVPLTNVANLFTSSGFTNIALGTGPIYYQWYFAPTNTPATFSPLPGQNSPALNLFLADYSTAGNYFLLASNSVNSGSLAFGPTNSIIEIAPLSATMLQLHNLLVTYTNVIAAGKVNPIQVNTNNVIVSGYVSMVAYGSGSYTEYYIQDASGLGAEVYLPGFGNTNGYPIGTYVTVSAPVEIYYGELELAPTSPSAITTNVAPLIPVTPRLMNYAFNSIATNNFGSTALTYQCSVVTFTNCYIYGNNKGGVLGITGNQHDGVGGIFESNYYTQVYFTANGPYNPATGNTNTWELYEPTYNYGPAANPILDNPFDDAPIPTNCVQLTGIYVPYSAGVAELIPSRLVDYVTNAPAPFVTSIAESKTGTATVTWPANPGSTYSVNSAAAINGPWTQAAYGLAYYPTNGSFTDTNKSPAKFYQITSP
jgi:hypothetical protein